MNPSEIKLTFVVVIITQLLISIYFLNSKRVHSPVIKTAPLYISVFLGFIYFVQYSHFISNDHHSSGPGYFVQMILYLPGALLQATLVYVAKHIGVENKLVFFYLFSLWVALLYSYPFYRLIKKQIKVSSNLQECNNAML